MTGTTLVLPAGVPSVPEGARELGIRNSPSLRLSIGFRNPERGNAPDKLDYFRAKEGAHQEFVGAARKFHSPVEEGGYGPTPRAIDIRLPARLEDAMRIEYLAFRGAKDDPLGGVMIARGQTNFAPLGYCGGPDTLTVWDEDGTVRHVETKGVDAITKQALDTTAAELGLMLCTTFCVGLPKILGFGSHAEITSKSLRSTDQVWRKLVSWYQAFPNGTITFAMRPLLVVRPAQARPVIKTRDGKIGRKRVLIYVLDVVQPESEDEMIARLEQYHGAVSPGLSPRAAVGELDAGAPAGAAPTGDAEEVTDAEIVEDSGPGGEQTDTSMLSPAPGPEQTLDAAEAAATPDRTPAEAAASGSQGPVAPAGVGGVEQHPADERAASQTPEEGPRSPTPETGGSAEEAPEMGARTPEPSQFVEQDAIPPLASGDASQQADTASVPGAVVAEPVLAAEPAPPDDEVTEADRQAAEQAGRMKPPFGSYQTRPLAAIVKNPNGPQWLEYAIGLSVAGKFKSGDARFERALWAFVKVELPELYATYKESAK